jgi:hypothetical protein
MPHRHTIRDEDRNRIKDLLPGRAGQPGVTAKDSREGFDSQAVVDKFDEKGGGGDPDPRDPRCAAGHPPRTVQGPELARAFLA